MATTYGRSPGGYFWTVLEPVAATALLAFVFSLALKAPPLGDNFSLFYAHGLLPFMLYIDVSTKVSQSIQFLASAIVLSKCYIFRALAARFILNFVMHIVIFVSVITGIVLFFSVHTIINYRSVFNSLTMAAVLLWALFN
jgi:capsular polysaccharide transport system permease protein